MPRSNFGLAGAQNEVAEHKLYDFRHLVPTTGNIFFVDSNVSSAGNGLSPSSAKATLDAAVALCTANNGDVIICMEGHAENISGAATVDLDVAGITVVGLGRGADRPTFTWTAVAGTFAIGADSVHVENLLFVANVTDGVTAAVDVDSTHDATTFKNCEWRSETNTKEFLKAVTVTASATHIVFEDCLFNEVAGGDASAAVFFEGAVTNPIFRRCVSVGDYSAANFDLDAAAITGKLLVMDCYLFNDDTTAGLCCTIDSSTVGVFVNTHVGGLKNNTVPVSDTSASVGLNSYGTDAVDTGGLRWPATATAWS